MARSSERRRPPPPEGPPWDAPLGRAPLAFVDLEMTGLDADRHRILQICIERVRGQDVEARLLTFIEPRGAPIGGTHIHGIEARHLEGAPSFGDRAEEVRSLLDGAIFVAHGARWDIAFLRAEWARLERDWTCSHYLDTLALSRRVIRAPRHALGALADQLGIDNPTPHRADNDVRVTRRLFDHLVAQLEPSTARDLWDVGVGRLTVRPEILERAERARTLRRAARVCYRPSSKPPQELSFLVTEIRGDLDPPMVLGYLLDTRGRRELRADRILSFELIGDETTS